jgi:cytidine deaminase
MPKLTKKQKIELLKQAKTAAEAAYSPYSGFKVGAALLTASGKIFTGCNVENASFSMTICAERTAIFKAVSEGETAFTAIAVYVDSDLSFPPCGACRQVLSEFADDLSVLIGNRLGDYTMTLAELLPGKFSLKK